MFTIKLYTMKNTQNVQTKKINFFINLPAIYAISIFSLLARLMNFGWLYILMTGVVDIIVRLVHLNISIKFSRCKTAMERPDRRWFFIAQISLIVASLFMEDFNDINSHTFMKLIVDPNPIYMQISLAASAVLIFADIKMSRIIKNKKAKVSTVSSLPEEVS